MSSLAVKKEKTDRALAVVITLIIHAGLLLFLLYYIIVTPIPPYPPPPAPELEVDLAGGGGSSGNIAAGSSGSNSSSEQTTTTKAAVVISANTPTVTNDVEPSTPIPSEKATKVPKKVDTVPKPQQPQVDIQLASALNRFKSAKGSPGGDANSGGTGNGSGLPGGGLGTGSGSGSGPGVGAGEGFGYDLKGRGIRIRPQLNSNNPEQGKIVVGITVDEDGNVIEATPGMIGSTLTDPNLYILVRNAALKMKFTKSPDDSPEQSGTVTFRFTIH